MKNSDNLVIIRSDGGICSQISFWSLGKYLEDKGFHIKYDLTWFDMFGCDLNHEYVRNYDMNKAFPDLKLKIASKEEVQKYQENYLLAGSIDDCKAPAYIGGYPNEKNVAAVVYADFLKKYFRPIDVDCIKDMLQAIESVSSCGVHVRRGDLATYCREYGYPTPKEYYLKAIKIIHGLNPQTVFFFFSEEWDWIKKEIIKDLAPDIKYVICDRNGADKGYLDLYLMSKCDYLISSSGSLAKYAKLLSDKNPILIMDKYSDIFAENLENIIILNDTILLNAQNNHKKLEYKNHYKKLSFWQKIFSIKNSVDKKYKIIMLFGLQIKIKKWWKK